MALCEEKLMNDSIPLLRTHTAHKEPWPNTDGDRQWSIISTYVVDLSLFKKVLQYYNFFSFLVSKTNYELRCRTVPLDSRPILYFFSFLSLKLWFGFSRLFILTDRSKRQYLATVKRKKVPYIKFIWLYYKRSSDTDAQVKKRSLAIRRPAYCSSHSPIPLTNIRYEINFRFKLAAEENSGKTILKDTAADFRRVECRCLFSSLPAVLIINFFKSDFKLFTFVLRKLQSYDLKMRLYLSRPATSMRQMALLKRYRINKLNIHR